MATEIKCPNCGHEFPMEEAVTEEYKKGLREQMQAFINNKEKEFIKKQDDFVRREKELVQQAQQREKELAQLSQEQEAAFNRRLEEEKRQVQAAVELSLRKTIAGDFEHKLRPLEDSNKTNQEKLKASRQREIEVPTKKE